jgi:primosomal protein N'
LRAGARAGPRHPPGSRIMRPVSAAFVSVVPDTTAMLPHERYTYSVPVEMRERVEPGVRVRIPFGPKTLMGLVVAGLDQTDHADVRPITEVVDTEPLLSRALVDLAEWTAARYCAPLAEVLKAMVPKGVRSARPETADRRKPRSTSAALSAARAVAPALAPPRLTPAQQVAAAPLLDAIATGTHRRVLLHGVTGSGKTEVYWPPSTPLWPGGCRPSAWSPRSP